MNFPKAKHSESGEGNKSLNSVRGLSQIVDENCGTTMVAVMLNFCTESCRTKKTKKKVKRSGRGMKRKEGWREKKNAINHLEKTGSVLFFFMNVSRVYPR